MKSYFAYIRVSTARQGEEGVSLQEQKSSILEYASKRGMHIAEWFEEQESAAKRGRPVFTRLVAMLKARRAAGIVSGAPVNCQFETRNDFVVCSAEIAVVKNQ